MNRLWLFYFPVLFLPNLGYSQATGFGTIEFSDLLIGPYIGLLLLAVPWGTRLQVGRLTPWLGILFGWAVLSTVTIAVRYGYPDDFQVTFGLLKVAKMALYGLAGILTARAVSRESSRRGFDWSLLGAAIVCGLSLWFTQSDLSPETEAAATGYSATNGISVMAAILMAYIGSRALIGGGSRLWQFAAPLGLVAVMAGSAVSDGRGGWVAGLAGAIYIVLRLGPTRRVILYGLAALIVVAILYDTQPEFSRQVDVTLFPVEEYGYQGTRTIGTLDDGGRFQTWDNEARKLDQAPILGTGIYHRGAASPLWSTGSHNFWLQMLLEVGIVGGILTIGIVAMMWRQATRTRIDGGPKADVPLKAALVAVIVGGLGGEYFYGGIILFTLFAVYAHTGGVPVAGSLVSMRARWQPAPAVATRRMAGIPGD